MIPSVLSGQVRRGIEEFLLTTFPVTTALHPWLDLGMRTPVNPDGIVRGCDFGGRSCSSRQMVD